MPKTSGSQPETLSRLRAMTQKQEQILQGADRKSVV